MNIKEETKFASLLLYNLICYFMIFCWHINQVSIESQGGVSCARFATPLTDQAIQAQDISLTSRLSCEMTKNNQGSHQSLTKRAISSFLKSYPCIRLSSDV